MSSVNLLTLARLISKDSNDGEYLKIEKYSMLSAGQEALATYLHPNYLRSLKKIKTHTSIASPGTVTAETDFLKRVHWEKSDGTDRKSTRLNSSHSQISYDVFC